MQDYLKGLNERQREAVLHVEGPLMIVAGAGSGKTKVLTTRIAHLMANGIDSFNILALTFTNKAAREMRERVEHILGNNEARNLYIGTFHSVFARILRSEAHRLGYPNNFTIYDTDDAKAVVKTVTNELNLDDKHYKPNVVYNRISAAKNSLTGPEEYRNDFYIQQEDMRSNRPAIASIYEAYAKRCFKNGAMDFDDLLFNMYRLLKEHPEALVKYQTRFRYILIDEYQDTNPAQYEIIKLLAAQHENICVVGDDAQSIYSFRGATIQNILQFRKDYEDAAIIKLEQNYRSTQSILNVANEVIKNNKGQIPKDLWTENLEGEKIQVIRTMTDNEEGKFVADAIQEQKLRNHYHHKDFAVLYRTNAQSRAFEESLRRMNIPYVIYGGISFYQRKEIKDFLAYLRVIVNPKDEESLKRIINFPARGIGKTSIDKVILFANEHNISMWETLENAKRLGFKPGTVESIENFVIMIRSFQSMLGKQNAYEVAFHVGKQTNIVKELFNDKSAEGVARYENIQELLNSVKEWIETPMNEEDGEVGDKGLAAYLQQIVLLTDQDQKDPDADMVKLMTIHSAKGLEFECVFVAGLEEMLFPNGLSVNTREELEEERRLFYVAITRAKSRLWLTYANSRYRFGSLVQNEPSRFINELPENFLNKTFGGSGSKNQGRGSWNRKSGLGLNKEWDGESGSVSKQSGTYFNEKQGARAARPEYFPPKVQPKTIEHTPSPDFTPDDTSGLQVGQRVEHAKFGFGLVTKMEGSAHNPVATVLFEQNGEKKIMLNYARLRIVE
ncbi:MAG: UvrD-helicase domain-containing protein [Chitinophagaceae bacterium]|jgi:DNA helicase-2/ATP-dependent DNA helicase PcrA|nr:UvrD-helicase domain-containing protein [Chitinophagaceae bacterium]OQY96845.1 MAG: ATP-dependent DNA helicase [Sphingobacteriales bacterium UTBCD1]